MLYPWLYRVPFWVGLFFSVSVWAFGSYKSLLHEAVSRSDLPVAQALIRENRELLATEGSWGETPLHGAARQGDVAMVAFLLDAGAHVNAADRSGFIPLHHAIHGGHLDVVRLLIERGASLSFLANGGDTPKALARRFGFVDIEQFLAEETVRRLGDSVLYQPAPQKVWEHLGLNEGNNLFVDVDMGFTKGITEQNVNVRDAYRNTLLHCAVDRLPSPRSTEIVRFLLGLGADVNAVNERGETPLMLATEQGNLKSVQLLIESGARVDSGEHLYFGGALHRAAYGGSRFFSRDRQHVDVLAFLLQRCPDLVNARDRMGNTPLHYAARYGRLEAVRLLLAHGADTTLENLHGETPLVYTRDNPILDVDVGEIVAILNQIEREPRPLELDEPRETEQDNAEDFEVGLPDREESMAVNATRVLPCAHLYTVREPREASF